MAYTTIDKPQEHFSIKAYAGNNTGEFKSTDFQLDWLWIKCRNNARSHLMYDSTRGFGADKHLVPNTAVLEDGDVDGGQVDAGERGYIGSLGSGTTGFRTNSAPSGMLLVNGSSNTYVAWYWKANGGSRTTFSESGNNPAGGYQANATAGFSIIDYTGTGGNGTIAHGLSSAPTFWVVKPRGDVSDNQWFICHRGFASDYATDFIHFDTNGAVQDNALMWNDTAPTSSAITLGSKPGTNKDAGSFICYAFHDVQGYSKFGSYTGNGSANGTFVYTGFKPKFIIAKRTDAAKSWYMADSTRSPINVNTAYLTIEDNAAEDTSGDNDNSYFDILSNGFRLRQDFSHLNASGAHHIYMAWAESPFVNSEGVPTTAR